jgi:hypothetical protein
MSEISPAPKIKAAVLRQVHKTALSRKSEKCGTNSENYREGSIWIDHLISE